MYKLLLLPQFSDEDTTWGDEFPQDHPAIKCGCIIIRIKLRAETRSLTFTLHWHW